MRMMGTAARVAGIAGAMVLAVMGPGMAADAPAGASADVAGLLKAFVQDDTNIWLNHGKTAFDYSDGGLGKFPTLAVTAPDLAQAYHDNEQTADKAYKGRTLKITGTVTEVSERVFGGLMLTLNAPPNQVTAFPKTGKGAESYRVGQQVTLICTGHGMMPGSPLVDACGSADSVRAAMAAFIGPEIDTWLAGKRLPRFAAKDAQQATILFTMYLIAQRMPPALSCATKIAEPACKDEVTRIDDTISSQEFDATYRAQAAYLHLPPLAESK